VLQGGAQLADWQGLVPPEMADDQLRGSAANALLEPAPIIVPQPEARPVEAAHPVVVEEQSGLKKIALLIAAPFIGLAYVVLFPFIGMGILATMGIKALVKLPMMRTPLTFLKNVALFIAAPFVGLAYVVLFPFVGAAMLAWVGVKALTTKPPIE